MDLFALPQELQDGVLHRMPLVSLARFRQAYPSLDTEEIYRAKLEAAKDDINLLFYLNENDMIIDWVKRMFYVGPTRTKDFERSITRLRERKADIDAALVRWVQVHVQSLIAFLSGSIHGYLLNEFFLALFKMKDFNTLLILFEELSPLSVIEFFLQYQANKNYGPDLAFIFSLLSDRLIKALLIHNNDKLYLPLVRFSAPEDMERYKAILAEITG